MPQSKHWDSDDDRMDGYNMSGSYLDDASDDDTSPLVVVLSASLAALAFAVVLFVLVRRCRQKRRNKGFKVSEFVGSREQRFIEAAQEHAAYDESMSTHSSFHAAAAAAAAASSSPPNNPPPNRQSADDHVITIPLASGGAELSKNPSRFSNKVAKACSIIKHKSPTLFARIPKNYELGCKLGNGTQGVVYKAFKKDGTPFAVKSISVGRDPSTEACNRLMKEVNVMVQLRNDYVIRCMGCRFEKATCMLNIFMEYADGGSLGDLARKTVLSEACARSYLHDILQGLAFLHKNGVVHRDIKGDNILLTAAHRAKISDFGACKELEANHKSRTIIGTPLFMAPEAITGEYCFASDVWSTGCVVVEMLTMGSPPWEPFRNHWQAMLVIGQWEEEMPPKLPENMSEEGLDFLRRCFSPKPDGRDTPVALLEHAFLQHDDALGNTSKVSAALGGIYNPSSLLGGSDLKGTLGRHSQSQDGGLLCGRTRDVSMHSDASAGGLLGRPARMASLTTAGGSSGTASSALPTVNSALTNSSMDASPPHLTVALL